MEVTRGGVGWGGGAVWYGCIDGVVFEKPFWGGLAASVISLRGAEVGWLCGNWYGSTSLDCCKFVEGGID